MKECCYILANLKSYGASKKKVTKHPNLITVNYQAYMKCTKCGALLKAEVAKNIHSRDTRKS